MSVGDRLREERVRLGLSQPSFAALAGASKGAQANWEKNDASPNANALIAFAEAGADALYILTGKRQDAPSAGGQARNHQQRLDQLEEWLERFTLNHLYDANPSAEEALTRESIRVELGEIATSETPDVRSTYRERADDLLRNHFDDDGAAKRRQARFSERGRLVERAELQLEDIAAGLSMELDAGMEQALLRLMLNYRINPNDLMPLLVEIAKLSERM